MFKNRVIMKNLKSLMVVCALVVAASAMAQDYNRFGISYNNNWFDFNDFFYGDNRDEEPSFSTNGVGLNYTHGFRLKRSTSIYIEVGGDISLGLKGKSENVIGSGVNYISKAQFQNLNLTVPVNFAWKFNLGKNFYITPYAGLSFKVNLLTRDRVGLSSNGKTAWADWTNYLKEDTSKGINKEDTWNVFQMGAHLGATFGWKHISLGIQHGGDFIPAYSVIIKYQGHSSRYAVNTTNFKLTLGYNF